MELFYTPAEKISLDDETLVIDGDEFHHLVRVLRKKEGERILVTDGHGFRSEVLISVIGKTSLQCRMLSHAHVDRPATSVTVALSLLKAPQRFELFLEKATELGVTSIIPMITARTLSQLSLDRAESKLNRWRTIMLSAARQSKRLYLPELCEPLSFSKVIALKGYDLKLIPYEGSEVPPGVQYAGKKTLFVIGGEGGFTASEIQNAGAAGFCAISLGKTTLRAETAGIFAIACVRAELLAEESIQWL